MTDPKLPELPESLCRMIADQTRSYEEALDLVELVRAYARAAVSQAKPEGDAHFTTDNASTRYLCGGPNGYFYTGDLEMARKLVNIIDPVGEDWTITDLANPFGVAPPTPIAGVSEAMDDVLRLLMPTPDVAGGAEQYGFMRGVEAARAAVKKALRAARGRG